MTEQSKTRKRAPGAGAPEGNQNAAKAPEEKSQKKLVSAWVEPDIHAALCALAKKKKSTPSGEAALLLTQAFRPPTSKTEP